MLAALERMAADDQTRVIVLVSKPPASGRRDARAARGAPCAETRRGELSRRGRRRRTRTIWCLPTRSTPRRRRPWPWCAVSRCQPDPRRCRRELVLRGRGRGQAVDGRQVGASSVCTAAGRCAKKPATCCTSCCQHAEHDLVDLGDDEFTVGRPHPMIDARLRSERIVAVGSQRRCGRVAARRRARLRLARRPGRRAGGGNCGGAAGGFARGALPGRGWLGVRDTPTTRRTWPTSRRNSVTSASCWRRRTPGRARSRR